MSQLNLNTYSQKGCIGCKPCEGGGANIGRNTTFWAIGICTAGIGLIFLPFFKKCQYCGHNTCMNKHYGPDQWSHGLNPMQENTTLPRAHARR